MRDLSELTPDIRALVEKGLADRAPGSKRVAELFARALTAVGYPAGDHWKPLYPTPASLTPAQRAVARALSNPGVAPIVGFQLPSHPDGCRRWLDEAGVLETTVVPVDHGGTTSREPLWRALQFKQLEGNGLRGVASVLNALPFSTALEAVGALLTSGEAMYKLNLTDLFASGELRLVRELGAEGQGWALRMSKELAGKKREGSVLAPFVFLALVRAKVPINLRLEQFFPDPGSVSRFRWKKPASPAYPRFGAEDYLELVAALPEARRDAVLAPLLYYAPDGWARAILGRYPSVPLARGLLDAHQRDIVQHKMSRDRYEAWVTHLRKLGKKHPALLEAVSASAASEPTPLELFILSRTTVREPKELDATARKQVLAAGKLWDAKSLPVEARFGEGSTSGPVGDDDLDPVWGFVEFLAVGDATGKRLYDVLLYADRAGTIFGVGKVKELGYLEDQQGIVLRKKDDALLLGLRQVLRTMRTLPGPALKGGSKKPAAAKS